MGAAGTECALLAGPVVGFDVGAGQLSVLDGVVGSLAGYAVGDGHRSGALVVAGDQ